MSPRQIPIAPSTTTLSRADELRARFGLPLQDSATYLSPLERARNDFVRRETGVDMSRSDGPTITSFFEKALGQGGVVLTSAARSAVFIPAALEKILTTAIEAGTDSEVPGLFESLQRGTVALEDNIMEATGLQSAALAQVVGEIAGGLLGGFGGLVSTAKLPASVATRLLGEKVGAGILRTMTLPQFAAQATRGENFRKTLQSVAKTAADGAFFTVSRSNYDEDTEARDVLLGTAFGAMAGTVAPALAIRKSKRLIQHMAEQTGMTMDVPVELMERILDGTNEQAPQNFLNYLANLNSHSDILRPAAIFQQNLDDKAVAAMRLNLAEAGKHGSSGAVRGLALDEAGINQLRSEFPNFRIEAVADELGETTVLYGRNPEALSSSTALTLRNPDLPPPPPTRMQHSGFLDDRAIDFYRRNGYLTRQRGLYKGQQVFVEGPAGPGKVNISTLGEGFSVQMPAVKLSEVSLLDDVVTELGNKDLLQQWQQHLAGFSGTWQEAFDAFANSLRAFDPSLKPAFRQYLIARSGDFIVNRLKPSSKAAFDQFKRIYAKIDWDKPESWDLVTEATAKGHVVTQLSGGRVKLTHSVSGASTNVMNQTAAREYLGNFRIADTVEAADFTPQIEGIPSEMLHGVAYVGPPANPSRPIDPIGKRPDFLYLGKAARALQLGGAVRNAEDSAVLFEQRGLGAIWSQGVQPLSLGITKVMNAEEKHLGTLERLLTTLDKIGGRSEHIRGWVLSEAADTYALQHKMSAGEVRVARGLSKLFDDVFDEWAASSQISLSKDDWLRNYLPSMREWVSAKGSLDVDNIWNARGKQIPKEAQFMGEFFKDGTIQGDEDIFVLAAKHIRSGFFKMHAGRAWENSVAFAKTVKDPDAKRFLVDYLASVRGMPEQTKVAMTQWLERFSSEMGVRASGTAHSEIIDNLVTLNSGALMAFRPSLVARNLMQNFQLLAPLLPRGDSRVLGAMGKLSGKATAQAARDYAEAVGAIRKQVPLTHGEVLNVVGASGGKGMRFARDVTKTGLKWFTDADEYNRAVAAVVVKDSMDGVKAAWTASKLSREDLLEHAGLHVQSVVKQVKFENILSTQGFEAARDFAAREMANHTNFLYGSANAPQWVRSAPGKLFGRFATWPAGYLNWVQHIAEANISGQKKFEIFAKHGALNAGMLIAGSAFGLNLSSWTPFASPLYTGGPFVDVAQDLLTIANGAQISVRGYEPGPDYNLAVSRMPSHLWSLVPGSSLFQTDFRRAAERQDQGEVGLAALEALGVRTVDPYAGPKPPLFDQLVPAGVQAQPGSYLLGQ